jgi:CheY-like chemotaxis protein
MSKERILVVDDELDNRVMMRYFLESWGYQVDLASNGQEALDKVNENQPRLVLLDLEMPIMNGFETCDRLKTAPDTEHIPVIMFTGLEQTADKVKGIRKGADDYVVKTVDPEELQARIEMILRRTSRYETREGASGGEESQVSGSLADLQFPEAVQLVLAYGKSGVMHLVDGDREARVYLKEGRVVQAEFEQAEGEEAFYKLAFWKSGQFRFQVCEPDAKQTITASGTNLLIEATRRLDEWNLISNKIPSFDVTPHRVPLADGNSIRLTPADWRVLRLADGERSITQIAEELEMDGFEAGRLTFGLLTVGALSLEPEPEHQDSQLETVPELAPELEGDDSLHLTALQWKVLAYIDGRHSIGALANRVGLPAATVAEMIEDMAGLGWVQLDQATSEADSPLKVSAPGEAEEPKPPKREAPKGSSANNVEEFQPRIRAIGFD